MLHRVHVHRRGGLGVRVDLQHSYLCSGFKSGELWREGMNTWVSLDSVLCQVYFFSLCLSKLGLGLGFGVCGQTGVCLAHTGHMVGVSEERKQPFIPSGFSGRLWRTVGQVYGLKEQKRSSRYMNPRMRVINKKAFCLWLSSTILLKKWCLDCVCLLLACIHGCVWLCTPLLRGTGQTVHCCGVTKAEHLWLKWVNNVCSHPQQTWWVLSYSVFAVGHRKHVCVSCVHDLKQHFATYNIHYTSMYVVCVCVWLCISHTAACSSTVKPHSLVY